jgi:putative PIN family toxin of toxin-antitoxin system
LGHKLVAVIDPNLFISGLFGRNTTTAELQELWIRQEFQLGTSLEIMKEVNRVLQYPRIKEHLIDDDETVSTFPAASEVEGALDKWHSLEIRLYGEFFPWFVAIAKGS